MRLFIACEISKAIREHLGEIIRRADPSVSGVKWIASGGVHVTLKFLGEVEDPMIDKVKSVLEKPLAEVEPFTLSVEGLGCFPPRGTPTVVWAGVSKGAEELRRLNGIVEESLEPAGFEREKRKFTVHATLGRVKRGARPDGLREFVSEAGAAGFGEQLVDGISLIRSVLQPTGAVYTPIHTWKLGNSRAGGRD